MPVPLVVKNGSVARASVSASMPSPVSRQRQPDIAAGTQLGVAHRDLVAGGDGQDAAGRHGIARIDGEIEQRRLELVRIGHHTVESEREAGFDGDLRPERALQQVAHAARQLDQVDRPQVELLPPREGQHALRQGGAALRALQGVVEQSA